LAERRCGFSQAGGPIKTASKGVNRALVLRLRGQRVYAFSPQCNAALATFEGLDRAKMPVKGALGREPVDPA
jgi:hypothetical protein